MLEEKGTDNPLQSEMTAFLTGFPGCFHEFVVPSAAYALLDQSLDMFWRSGVPGNELDLAFRCRNDGGGHFEQYWGLGGRSEMEENSKGNKDILIVFF